MTYTVYYKKTNSFLWNKILKVKGDGILPENGSIRYFICEDETRYEISMENTVFKFSKERFSLILKNMSKESGQDIKV